MIRFKKLIIEGFGSITGPFKYNLDELGLTIISGTNGVGKSSIFNALFWCLYGKLLNKLSVETWEDKRPKNFKGTRVSISFIKQGIKYKLIRCKDYNKKIEGHKGNNRLILYENGKVSNIKDKRVIQKYVINVLGYSDILFKNSVLFGQNLDRLIKQGNANKKEILEEAFEISYISKAKEKADKEKRDLLIKLGKIEPDYERILGDIKGRKLLIKEQNKQRKAFDKSRKENIKRIKSEIKDLEKALELKPVISSNLSNIPTIIKMVQQKLDIITQDKDKQSKLKTEEFKLQLSYENCEDKYQRALKAYNNHKESKNVCIACKQKINSKTHASIRKEHEKDCRRFKAELKVAKASLDLFRRDNSSILNKSFNDSHVRNRIKKLENELSSQEMKLLSIQSKEKEIDKLKGELIRYKNNKLEDNSVKYKSELKTLRDKIKPLKEQRKFIKRKIKLYEWAIKDPLSNTGIKAYMFNVMIKIFNQALLKYSQYLGYGIQFMVDLESNRKDIHVIINYAGGPRLYEDLSGGQKQLVDICIAFAIHDALESTKECNILIMDEIFENVAKENIDLVSELIKIKANTKSVHLTTHRQEFQYSNARLIQLSLIDGRTAIVQ